jgi:hypothetical protein
MNIRPFIHASLLLASIPLTACGGGDDDSGANDAGTASPLAGHTYVLTTDNTSWTKPRGIAKDVENVMPHFLFQVTAAGGNNVKVLMSVAPKVKNADGEVLLQINQDMCSPTHEFMSSGAAAQLGPEDLKLHLVNTVKLEDQNDDLQVTAVVKGLEFKNIFPADGKAWTVDQVANEDYPGELNATMDFRELAPLFNVLYHPDGAPPTPKEICDQLPDTASCADCGDGSITCLSAQASLLHAEDHPGLTVQPVDINTRPATCK